MIISFNTGKIETKGGGGNLQQKRIEVTENGLDVVVPDAGYDGLSTVYIKTEIPQEVELSSIEVDINENGSVLLTSENGKGYNEVKINTDVEDTSDLDYYNENKKNFKYFDFDEYGINKTTMVRDTSRFVIVDGWNHFYYDPEYGEYRQQKNINGEDYITPFVDYQTLEKLDADKVIPLANGEYIINNIITNSDPISEVQYYSFNGEVKRIYTTDRSSFDNSVALYRITQWSEEYYLENPITYQIYHYVSLPLSPSGYIKLVDTNYYGLDCYRYIKWGDYKGGEMTLNGYSPNNWIRSISGTHIVPNEFSDNYPVYLPFLYIEGMLAEEYIWVFKELDRTDVFYKNIKRIKGLELVGHKDCGGICNDCSELEKIDYITWGEVTNLNGMFSNCCKLQYIPTSGIITTGLTSCNSLFAYCASLDNIDMSDWDMSKVTDSASLFRECSNLTNLKFGYNFKCRYDMYLDDCPKLTVDSLLSVLNGLYDFTGNGVTPNSLQGKIRFGTTHLAKLIDEQKAIATSKGWVLS